MDNLEGQSAYEHTPRYNHETRLNMRSNYSQTTLNLVVVVDKVSFELFNYIWFYIRNIKSTDYLIMDPPEVENQLISYASGVVTRMCGPSAGMNNS